MSRLGPCRARISGDRHTHTDTQTKYSNPRCACASRVNNQLHHYIYVPFLTYMYAIVVVLYVFNSYSYIQPDQWYSFYTCCILPVPDGPHWLSIF